MMEKSETIVINGAKEEVEDIRKSIDEQPGSQSHLTTRRNLDGETAAWIVIATLTAQTLPAILTFIKDYLTTKHVKKIRVGDIEIENPSPEDLERLRRLIHSRTVKENT